jgi:exodeoxyribonuclease VII small subunit
MANSKNKNDANQPEPTFEEALERLEAIVGQMEDGTLGLDDLMARFEEGQALIRLCTGKLNEVEKKVELLMKKGDAVESQPFKGEAGEGEGGDK